jgi:hypothetical protein
VAELPALVAWKTGRCDLLWWPHYYLLWLWGRNTIVLLLAIIVVAGITATDITSDCPNTVVEGDTGDLRVGYTPYSTLEEHR